MPDTSNFTPSTAIVTASDSGIGKATAVALARAGMDVGVTWHSDEEGAEKTAGEIRGLGRKAVVRHLDTTELRSAAGVIDDLAAELGGLDVFVNNAGTGASTGFLDMGIDDWMRILDTNLNGAFVCLQAAARRMVQAGTGGRLIAVSSVHEFQPRVGSSAYDASKHGLGGLMKTMALELGQHGITANTVAPGEIATPMTGQEDQDPTVTQRPGVPLGVPATRGKSRTSLRSSPRPRPATSPARPGWWTGGCCRWDRRRAHTSPATIGARRRQVSGSGGPVGSAAG